ncbi:hypothetical protein K466DRAFT_348618 [Polyporus arcularius HHB13444]|uniref:Uncharacterized protein n=1 Tax=Polyporus arcularius HHB13444 TaxID=1314778 RepID=A0A5C3NV35_9APHY|nr:hypothetical protein K466DRAFT_348618 [Polyporus arcularius HHB13444]
MVASKSEASSSERARSTRPSPSPCGRCCAYLAHCCPLPMGPSLKTYTIPSGTSGGQSGEWSPYPSAPSRSLEENLHHRTSDDRCCSPAVRLPCSADVMIPTESGALRWQEMRFVFPPTTRTRFMNGYVCMPARSGLCTNTGCPRHMTEQLKGWPPLELPRNHRVTRLSLSRATANAHV